MHIIRCELRTTTGKLFKAKISFRLKASPTIEVETAENGSLLFDPLVTIGFVDKESEVAGHLEVHLDERPIAIVPVAQSDNNKQRPLSKLLQKENFTTPLGQGNHLIRLVAYAINGSETVRYMPFSVDMTPKLKIIRGENEQLKEIKAVFIESSEGFSGFLNIYYQQGVILSKRSREKQLLVTRAEIVSALEEHNQPVPTEATSFVISINSANGVVEWQEIIFR
jgi:hypothetical protein